MASRLAPQFAAGARADRGTPYAGRARARPYVAKAAQWHDTLVVQMVAPDHICEWHMGRVRWHPGITPHPHMAGHVLFGP